MQKPVTTKYARSFFYNRTKNSLSEWTRTHVFAFDYRDDDTHYHNTDSSLFSSNQMISKKMVDDCK